MSAAAVQPDAPSDAPATDRPGADPGRRAPGRKRTLRSAPDPEVTAERLLRSSAERSYDPDAFVPWDEPLVDGLWFAPPELLSLYGTELWGRMDEQQRIELSKQETCSIAISTT